MRLFAVCINSLVSAADQAAEAVKKPGILAQTL
jgi:hypothetical protein